jgi:hypothetical protein
VEVALTPRNWHAYIVSSSTATGSSTQKLVGGGTRDDEGLDGGSAHVTLSVTRALCVLSSEAGSGGV